MALLAQCHQRMHIESSWWELRNSAEQLFVLQTLDSTIGHGHRCNAMKRRKLTVCRGAIGYSTRSAIAPHGPRDLEYTSPRQQPFTCILGLATQHQHRAPLSETHSSSSWFAHHGEGGVGCEKLA